MLTLRLRKRDQRLPDEHVLDAEYVIDEVQEEINTAIDQRFELQLLLADGSTLKFDPREYQVVSVALPTDLTEKK